MKKIEGLNNKLKQFFNQLYIKLFTINDSPQKIALGLGLGVFSGVLPGTGPLAALFLAFLFRANRASALIGSLLTNTWLSFLTFILAIKVGAAILGIKWQEVQQAWVNFLKNFNWLNLFKISALKIVWPVMLGYLVVTFCLGLCVYLITLLILTKHRRIK